MVIKNKIILNERYDVGIHYDYKSTRSAKAMKKKAEKEKRLLERRQKRALKMGHEKDKHDEKEMHPIDKVISL